MNQKERALCDELSSLGSVIVAYSGGYLPAVWSVYVGGANERVRGMILLDALYAGALSYLHGDLHLRLVPRMSGPCGQDDRSVVLGQLLVGPLDPGLVAARDADCGAKLIRDHCSGHPAQVLEGSHVARDPVVALLRPARLGEGEARGAEHCDEQLRLPHLADLGVDHPRMLPGVVDEQLLPRAVHLPHRSALRADPAPIPLAELRVTVSVGMALEVLVM